MALVPFPSKGTKSVSERDPDDWDDDDAPEESGGKMSFLDHLDELRSRLMWALGAVVLGFADRRRLLPAAVRLRDRTRCRRCCRRASS